MGLRFSVGFAMSGERRYLLDTNALIALGNGDGRLLAKLSRADYVATSIICKVEYLTGIPKDSTDRILFEQFLSGIDVVDLRNADGTMVDEIIDMRFANKHIKLPDAIVMAAANVVNATLVTNDKQLKNSGLCQTVGF